jgi:hypothetical protein
LGGPPMLEKPQRNIDNPPIQNLSSETLRLSTR